MDGTMMRRTANIINGTIIITFASLMILGVLFISQPNILNIDIVRW